MKPSLLMVYAYDNANHPDRLKFSGPYLLEQALKEYFDVYHLGEIEDPDVSFVTEPWNAFVKGKKTMIYLDREVPFSKECDWMFFNHPTYETSRPEISSFLLDAGIDEYKEYKSPIKYEVGFLGATRIRERVKFVEELGERVNLKFANNLSLGEESARFLSECALTLIVDDYDLMGEPINWIDRRIFTFGNVRPILIPWNPDYDQIGQDGVHYISYKGLDDLVNKINYYLAHMDEAEKIGDNLKKLIKEKHQYSDRAKQIYDTYLKL